MGEIYVQEFGPGSGSIKLFLLGGFQSPRPPGEGPAAPGLSVDLGTKILVPRSWYQDLGTRILVSGSWYQDLGTRILVPGSWYQDLGTKILVPGSWYQDFGTKILVPRFWYQDLGTNILVPRSWYQDLRRAREAEPLAGTAGPPQITENIFRLYS